MTANELWHGFVAFNDFFRDWFHAADGDIFAGFLTAFVFIFGVKKQLILFLKEKIYDKKEYQAQLLRAQDDDNLNRLDHTYDSLLRINTLFKHVALSCLLTAFVQYAFPDIPYCGAVMALLLTVGTAVYILRAFIISERLFSDYLKHIPKPVEAEVRCWMELGDKSQAPRKKTTSER